MDDDDDELDEVADSLFHFVSFHFMRWVWILGYIRVLYGVWKYVYVPSIVLYVCT